QDLVLQKDEVSDPTRSRGKLALNWKGSYRVIKDFSRQNLLPRDNIRGGASNDMAHCKNKEVLCHFPNL
ncbi:hypothetical protein B296_00044947, partial [Ensete ventricosum]